MKKTKIIAHRGFSSQFPENTLIAFQKAIDIGADFIELDVHKTKDNILVVVHDDSVDRTSSNNKKGFISEMTLAELENVNVGYSKKFGDQFKNEKIPTLLEVLELAKGKIKVCIEIKVLYAEKEILEIIKNLEMENEVVIFSFSDTVLRKFHKLNAAIPTLYLIEAYSEEDIIKADKIGCFAIGVGNESFIIKELVDFVHSKNLEIWQWTIDDEVEMQKLITQKIDGLITNKPDHALTLVQKM